MQSASHGRVGRACTVGGRTRLTHLELSVQIPREGIRKVAGVARELQTGHNKPHRPFLPHTVVVGSSAFRSQLSCRCALPLTRAAPAW